MKLTTTLSRAKRLEPSEIPDCRVALLGHSLSGGGQARVWANLASALTRFGYRVDLLFFITPGPSPHDVPATVNVIDLRAGGNWRQLCRFLAVHPASLMLLFWHALVKSQPLRQPGRHGITRHLLPLPALVRYLRESPPSVIYAAGTRPNLLAVWARRIAGPGTGVVVGHHNLMSEILRSHVVKLGSGRAHLGLRLMRRAYLRADAIVSPSDGAAGDLAQTARIPCERITTIHNPVVAPELPTLAKSPLDDPWFRAGAPPVILSVGRLVQQKDFPTLIRAFARVRRQRQARLVILGEGRLRGKLETLAAELGVADEVALPGFAANPFARMARAGVFVLSSTWESLGMVLVEALACGCPVVSTDCPEGPSEILQGGAIGPLVPVGDAAALAAAITATLDNPPPRERLVDWGMQFTAERSAKQYARFIPSDSGGKATH